MLEKLEIAFRDGFIHLTIDKENNKLQALIALKTGPNLTGEFIQINEETCESFNELFTLLAHIADCVAATNDGKFGVDYSVSFIKSVLDVYTNN